MLERGANPNLLSWKTRVKSSERSLRQDKDAIGTCISMARLNKNKPELSVIYAKKLTELLDLLLEYGADIEAWADRPVDYYSEDTSRKLYIDDFVPVPDRTFDVIQRGRKTIRIDDDKPIELEKGDRRETIFIDGSIDRVAEMRAFMQDFCKKRGLLGK